MSDQNAIVVHQAGFLAPVVGVQQALEAYQAKKELIEGIMKKDVDFITIPGTSKPTLAKAGAEKATSFFGLHPVFTDAEVINDWTGKDHDGEPFFFYRRTCNLYRGDTLIASVDGSCNSWEVKYRYRWVDENSLPANADKASMKTQGGRISEFAFAIEKSETAGQYGKPAEYWKRFTDAIEQGTATATKRKTKTGKEMDAWEINSTVYRVVNMDTADIVNTVLKMADKRALVAATLIATGLSEYFTQDIEDYVTGEYTDVSEPVKPKPAEPKQPARELTLQEACDIVNREGIRYGDLTTDKLQFMAKSISGSGKELNDMQLEKLAAMSMIIKAREDGTLTDPGLPLDTMPERMDHSEMPIFNKHEND